MSFLRALFWIAITVVVVVFSLHNWNPVTLDLFGGLQADVKLPVLLMLAFLLGFLPLYAYHRVQRWRDRRRIADMSRTIATAPTPPPAMPMTTDPAPEAF